MSDKKNHKQSYCTDEPQIDEVTIQASFVKLALDDLDYCYTYEIYIIIK